MASKDRTDEVGAGQPAGGPVFDSYARLSWNPSTRELEKIETQHGDNDATITRHGGTIGQYLDDGLSAWKAGVRRKGFETLLERARSGVTQGIAVWHVDRLFRQPRDLERLIDLADHGFRVISSHGSRDLSDPDDRFILRIEVAHAARSSEDTSRRIRRRQQRYREEGRPVGGTPGFGFPRRERPPAGIRRGSVRPDEPDPELERPLVPDEQVDGERRALRDAVADLLAGVSNQSQIARSWNAAGLVTATGQRWTSDRVRDTLLRPVLCGRIEHDGELISRMPGDPLIPERDWLRLRALVESRRRGRPHSPRYLASGVLRCGGCGTKMSGHTATTRGRELRRYICHAHRGGCGVTIEMTGTDRELRALTIARLSDSRYAAAIATARAQVSQRLAIVTAEIEQIEALAGALSEKVGRREMTLADFEKSYSFLRADLDSLLAEREQLAGGSIEGPTEALSGAEVARHWDEAESVQERRAMLIDAIGSDQVRVLPSIPGTRVHVFNPDRIVLGPADAPLTPRTR
jgi:DNA invertase Pin-like site-specific DNA recombinase